jgi:hypothetical protein
LRATFHDKLVAAGAVGERGGGGREEEGEGEGEGEGGGTGGGGRGKEAFAFGLVLSGEVEEHARDVLADILRTPEYAGKYAQSYTYSEIITRY